MAGMRESIFADTLLLFCCFFFIGRSSPTRAAFKIAWTEMFHLPRNVDGSQMTSRLTEGGNPEDPLGDGCEFPCPGDQGLCIPERLVCNGVVNCPNVTDYKGNLFIFLYYLKN